MRIGKGERAGRMRLGRRGEGGRRGRRGNRESRTIRMGEGGGVK